VVCHCLRIVLPWHAGKDLVSSLASGLLTIGDRFGGALDGAARQFSWAYDNVCLLQTRVFRC
jgi:ATP citrate (pro-S)-lyase